MITANNILAIINAIFAIADIAIVASGFYRVEILPVIFTQFLFLIFWLVEEDNIRKEK